MHFTPEMVTTQIPQFLKNGLPLLRGVFHHRSVDKVICEPRERIGQFLEELLVHRLEMILDLFVDGVWPHRKGCIRCALENGETFCLIHTKVGYFGDSER